MINRGLLAFGLALTSVSGAAYAQGADAGAPPAAAEGQAQITIQQQDIENFAKSVLEFEEIDQNAALNEEEKQVAKLSVVEGNDLDPVKFNAIANASQTNDELRQLLQVAIANEQQSRMAQ